MLPNLRFLICGVLFCFLLFAVTGAGVMLPDARTRVGEMPEIGRPMMQRSMMDAPAQAQIYMITAARRTDELERLRAVSAQPEPDLPKIDAVADPAPPEANMGEEAEVSIQIPRTENVREDLPPTPQVAALVPAPAESGEPVPILGRILGRIPLPPRRPAFVNALQRRVRTLHARRHTLQPSDTPGQDIVVPSQAIIPGQQAVMPVQGVTASQSAPPAAGGPEAGRRHPLP